MLDYKKETEKMIEKTSAELAKVVASQAFEFWKRKDFRLYVDFNNISQTEQDRMFNELEVSALGMFDLHLADGLSGDNEAAAIVLKGLQKGLPKAFVTLLTEVGIEGKYIKIWEKLIDMRFKEYKEDLQLALKESVDMEEFKGEDELRYTWARIETITIDCLTHIRRGDVKEEDPLWKLLRKWFITVDTMLAPITQMTHQDPPQGKN